MKLDDLPLNVLAAMVDAVANPSPDDLDRETLRARGAGFYVMRGDDTVEVDDKLLPGDRPVYLRFRSAG